MWRLPVTLACVGSILGLPVRSGACTCIGATARDYFDRADLVFLGRAMGVRVKGKHSEQTLVVIHALKGLAGRRVVLRTEAGVINTCLRHFGRGEVALVFVKQGRAGICGGNYDLSVQMQKMPEYLRLAGAASSGATPEVLTAAIQRAIVSTRPGETLSVRYPPLAGSSAPGLRFSQGKADVVIHESLSRGPVHYLSGAHLARARLFSALVLLHPRGRVDPLHVTRHEGCREIVVCKDHGRCAFDRATGRCTARSDDDCASCWICSSFGRCTARRGACVVASDADCRRSELCKVNGRCIADGAGCRAGSRGDCLQSQTCREFGDCSLRHGGDCAPASPDDCRRASVSCAMNGRCSYQSSQCVVSSDADCRRADACIRHGRCRAVGGECVR